MTCAASVFAQGTVLFNTRIANTFVQHVYAPNAANTGLVQTGNGTADFAAGTTDWTGWTGLQGTGFTAELWAANGANQPESSLQAATPTQTFRTTAAGAGFVLGTTATLTGVPLDAPVATLALRVWDNRGGTITSWAAASALALTDPTYALGESPLFNLNNIGGQVNQAPSLNGLVSFNIHTTVPEPSTFALAGLGAAALLILRRRK